MSTNMPDQSHILVRAPIDFDIGAFFEPYVRQWLLNTDNKTAQWVQAVSRSNSDDH
jgi:hypothetical protein